MGKLCFICEEGEGGGRSIASETWLGSPGECTERQRAVRERGGGAPSSQRCDQLLAGPLYKFKTGGKNVTLFRVEPATIWDRSKHWRVTEIPNVIILRFQQVACG